MCSIIAGAMTPPVLCGPASEVSIDVTVIVSHRGVGVPDDDARSFRNCAFAWTISGDTDGASRAYPPDRASGTP